MNTRELETRLRRQTLVLVASGLIWPAGAAAQPLERLLLSPPQRAALERARASARERNSAAGSSTPAEGPATAAAQPQAPAQIQGWVLRHRGRSTVWVDGVPYYGFDEPGPAREQLARRGLVRGKTDALAGRPGQGVDDSARLSGDLLPPGALQIRKPGGDASRK